MKAIAIVFALSLVACKPPADVMTPDPEDVKTVKREQEEIKEDLDDMIERAKREIERRKVRVSPEVVEGPPKV